MPSTFSTSLRLELPQNGEQSGTWGQTLNNDLNLIEQAVAGITDLYLTGDVTMTNFNGLPDEARSAVISCTGALSSPANVIAPSVQKTYIVTNNTGANVTIKTQTGNGVTVLNTTSTLVYCDGTNFYQAVSLNSVTGNQTISGNEVIGANLTASGNLTVTSNVTSYNGSLALYSNTSVVTAAVNTGAYTPPTGTTAQRPASPTGGMSRFNTDAGVYEIFNGTVWQPITGAYAANYLIVAGGGGGGASGGGSGGGAGGLLANVASVQPGTSYSIVIGSGGATNAQGANSSAFSLTAIGGGKGVNNVNAGGSGGSGGGAADHSPGSAQPTQNGGSGTSGQGNSGGNAGNGSDELVSGAGGGGAGGSGGSGNGGNPATGGAGGIGYQSSIAGTNTYYAGGGGGQGSNGQTSSPGGSGGSGGGGNGGLGNTGGGGSGTSNTGGGGGGAGGVGGSGVVIVSYPSASQRATGGTVTTYTSSGTVYWVHTFTTSGTFTA